jgi:hypothetical protein
MVKPVPSCGTRIFENKKVTKLLKLQKEFHEISSRINTET